MNTHTPGPWVHDTEGITTASGCRLVYDPCITKANGAVLAAAPELLAALEEIDCYLDEAPTVRAIAHAAIAKAKVES